MTRYCLLCALVMGAIDAANQLFKVRLPERTLCEPHTIDSCYIERLYSHQQQEIRNSRIHNLRHRGDVIIRASEIQHYQVHGNIHAIASKVCNGSVSGNLHANGVWGERCTVIGYMHMRSSTLESLTIEPPHHDTIRYTSPTSIPNAWRIENSDVRKVYLYSDQYQHARMTVLSPQCETKIIFSGTCTGEVHTDTPQCVSIIGGILRQTQT